MLTTEQKQIIANLNDIIDSELDDASKAAEVYNLFKTYSCFNKNGTIIAQAAGDEYSPIRKSLLNTLPLTFEALFVASGGFISFAPEKRYEYHSYRNLSSLMHKEPFNDASKIVKGSKLYRSEESCLEAFFSEFQIEEGVKISEAKERMFDRGLRVDVGTPLYYYEDEHGVLQCRPMDNPPPRGHQP